MPVVLCLMITLGLVVPAPRPVPQSWSRLRSPAAATIASAASARRELAPARGDAYGWPLSPAHVTRGFDPPPAPWLAGHRGADLAGAPGELVRSAGPGRIVYAGVLAGRGVVSVAHPSGLRTTYEPLTPAVHLGDDVGTGTVLGRLQPGHPGCTEPACLHWGLRRGDLYLDPLALLGLGRVRLLPLGAAA